MSDNLTLSGANELARRITAYWGAKGKIVKTNIEQFVSPKSDGSWTEPIYSVRSDMVNGLPRY